MALEPRQIFYVESPRLPLELPSCEESEAPHSVIGATVIREKRTVDMFQAGSRIRRTAFQHPIARISRGCSMQGAEIEDSRAPSGMDFSEHSISA